MEIIEYLQQAKHLEELIRNDQQELISLRELATSISAIDYSKVRVTEQSSETTARFTQTIEKIMELEDFINEKTVQLIELHLTLNKLIGELPVEEQIILKKKYLRGFTWEEVGKQMGMSSRTAIRIHNKALKKITISKSCHCLS